ncbi:hypothetical protein PENSTE_c001G08562 [Penicillium steckii]|uniref:Uncharacterized protein n=1 Tax=Penicillium steckii TaxID=303698 RepID=A0A1V6TZT4_9EURO|nr:hypothetical protein PENSTE_c001G08562 [Penicillium steckii]
MRPSRSSVPSARKSAPSSRGSVPRTWPPPPFAEEETTSLAKELNGLLKLSENPGVEGAIQRGTVDQYPIIVGLDLPPSSASITPPSISSVPGLENVSSDDSSGPVTPPPVAPEPPSLKTPLSRPQSTARPHPPPSASAGSNRPRGRPPAQVHQQSARDTSISRPRQPRPRSISRGPPPPMEEVPVLIAPHKSRTERPERPRSRSRGPVYEKGPSSSGKSSLGRSNSARYTTSKPRFGPSQRQCEKSGYLSDSVTIQSRKPPGLSSSTPPVAQTSALSVAERLEEKLRLRQEMRERQQDRGEAVSLSDTETRSKVSRVKPPVASGSTLITDNRESQPLPPPIEPDRGPNFRTNERPPVTRSRTTSVSSVAPPPPGSESRTRKTSRSISSDDAPSGQRKSSRPPPSVKFQEKQVPKRTLSQSATTRQPSPSQKHPNPSGLCLMPCPRSTPVTGHQDWYTLKGLTHLDICPTCMNQIAHSRFRDFFIPSLPQSPDQAIRCAFSNPWTRLAWTQMIKKKHDSLEVLYQMTRPPPGTRRCPGRIITNQTWHRVVDPDTGLYLPRFQVCGSCTRKVRILMPAHRDTFTHCPEPKERVCDFVPNSPRFVQFIDLLDTSATRAEKDPSRRPDIREFLSYARRKVVLRDCRRDRPVMSTWHYIPSLPELSVCEDCYDEVVWPLAKSNHAIARMFSTSMRLLPGDGPNRCREASCQLYSSRMRNLFRDATSKDDFQALKNISLRRFEAEQRFKDRREELIIAEKKGYDCDVEMKKAVDEWRRFE